MYLRKAKAEEIDLVCDIIEDGKKQLADAGIDQWQNNYPNRAVIEGDIEDGRAVIYNSDDHETLGVAAVIEAPDHAYDTMKGEWLSDATKYVTVHRVAISPIIKARATRPNCSGICSTTSMNIIQKLKVSGSIRTGTT